MALSQGKVSLDKCPDITEESKKFLSSVSKPPVSTVKWGKDRSIVAGGETVLFRHEKKFNNSPAFAVYLTDLMEESEILERIEFFEKAEFNLIGNVFKLDAFALKFEKDEQKFLSIFEKVKNYSLVLDISDFELLKKVLDKLDSNVPVFVVESSENLGFFKEKNLPVAVKAGECEIEEKLKGTDYEDMFLFLETQNFKNTVGAFSSAREKAILEKNRSYSCPLIGFAGKSIELASAHVCKYASIVIVDTKKYEDILPLMTLRLNIYTDPQKPLQVEPKLYEIGKADENSPVLITTNFSLTYFLVRAEIENSRIPSHLITTDSEGMSVLTAWSADKFNSELIANAIKKSGIEEKVKHRNLIIPGYVPILKAKIEDETGWQVVVGPKEASGIPRFLGQFQK